MPRWLSIKVNHAPCRAFNLSIKISVEGGVFIFVKKGKRWTAIYHNYQEREGTNLAQGKEKKKRSNKPCCPYDRVREIALHCCQKVNTTKTFVIIKETDKPPLLHVVHQTQKTFETLRRELKMRRTAEYLWETSRRLEVCSNTFLSLLECWIYLVNRN